MEYNVIDEQQHIDEHIDEQQHIVEHMDEHIDEYIDEHIDEHIDSLNNEKIKELILKISKLNQKEKKHILNILI